MDKGVIFRTGIAAALGLAIGGGMVGAAWMKRHPNAARHVTGLSGRAHAADPAASPAGPAPAAGAPTTAGSSAAPAQPPAAAPASAPAAAGALIGPDGLPTRFALGINEAVSFPQKKAREARFVGAGLVSHLDGDVDRTIDLGARFVRGNTGAFPRTSWWSSQNEPTSRDDTDTWVRAVQKRGLEPILMVGPWPGNRTANYTEQYVPADMAAYTAWVRTLVERYDGDGVDDMPGLTAGVRYWEVDNEPDLKFTTQPREATREVKPGSFCSPQEAAEVLLATSRAIREAHPDAKVLNGGIYRPFAKNGQDYLRAMFAVPGVAEAVDIVSLHSYASDEPGDQYAEGLAAARAITGGKPIFVTETSVPSEGDKRWMTPEWQARFVALVAARGAAAGARAVLWHTLGDPPARSQGKTGFEQHSLLDQLDSGAFVDKPAAVVYRALAARLAVDDLTGAVEDGEGGVRLTSGATLLYAGSRNAPRGGYDLRGGAAIAPGAQATAPAWLSP